MAYRKNSGRADNCCEDCKETPCDPCGDGTHGDVWLICASLGNHLEKCGFEDPEHTAGPCEEKTIYRVHEVCGGDCLLAVTTASREFNPGPPPSGCVETCGSCGIHTTEESNMYCNPNVFVQDGVHYSTETMTETFTPNPFSPQGGIESGFSISGGVSGDLVRTSTIFDCGLNVVWSGSLTIDITLDNGTNTSQMTGTLSITDPSDPSGRYDGTVTITYSNGDPSVTGLYSDIGSGPWFHSSSSLSFEYSSVLPPPAGYTDPELTPELIDSARSCINCLPVTGTDCAAYLHVTWDGTQCFTQQTTPTLHWLPQSCYLKVWFEKVTTHKTTANPCTGDPEVVRSTSTDESTFEWDPGEGCSMDEQVNALDTIPVPSDTVAAGDEITIEFSITKYSWVSGYEPTGLSDSGFPPP